MSEQEVKDFLMMMNAYYPNWKPDVPIPLIAKAWYTDLRRFSVDDVNNAFTVYRMQGNQFPPSQPGVLVSLMVDATDDSLSEAEAWHLVTIAKRNGIYGAEKEFAALPEDVQKAVGAPGQLTQWALEKPEAASVVESNFKKAYREVLKQKRERRQTPNAVKNALGTSETLLIALADKV